jgi:hypothetical protein
MPDWMIMITGDPSDLEALGKTFDVGDPRVFTDRDDHFLESSDVRAIRAEADAKTRALELVSMLNGAMRVQHGNRFEPVKFGGLVTFNPQGGPNYYDSGTVVMRLRVSSAGELIDAAGNPVPPPPSPVPKWIGKRSDATVAAVLRILGRDQLDWYDAYKVYESIRHDVGDAQVKLWEPEVDRFRRTANNAGALGDDARHPELGWQPPIRPMTLAEAISLVYGLTREWLAQK